MENQLISSSFDLISHPDRTLETHLKNCDELSKKIFNNKFISNSFFNKNDLENIRKVLIYFHDFGKATDFFQCKIIEATETQNPDFASKNEDYIEWFKKFKEKNARTKLNSEPNLSNHSITGAYFQFSKYLSSDSIVNLIMIEIIKRHHGYLRNFEKGEFWLNEEINMNLSELKEQINYLNYDAFQNIVHKFGFKIDKSTWDSVIEGYTKGRILNKSIGDLKNKNDLRYFFLQHFLYSLLLSADKGDMMLGSFQLLIDNNLIKEDAVSNYKNNKIQRNKEIDNVREDAYTAIINNLKNNIENNFFSITLPTGLGKTFSAYNVAVYLQNKLEEHNFRIVYCLPFTSIIDQNEKVLSDIFNYNGLDTNMICKHHHLSDYKNEYNDNELLYSEAEYLTEGWEHGVIVTTFVQFLESIFTNKNRSLRKFHNLVNSIIILDEVQNIPPKYYNLIEATFRKMAEYFGTKFIFVTATQPILFQDNSIIIELTDPERENTKKYFDMMDRIQLNKSLLNNGVISDENIIKLIQTDINNNPHKSFLIISNTIKQSQLIFSRLDTDCKKYYLSASVLPILRKERIESIKSSSDRKIVVSTQVVEAGVDIDLDIVYRDFAPLDSINQSAGRCNRNACNEKGIVKLYNSGKASKIYDPTLLCITKKILSKYPDIIEEKMFYHLSSDYFTEVKIKVQNYNDVSKRLLSYLYELQLEKLSNEFRLIDDLPIFIDVFIPIDEQAVNFWNQYIKCFQEVDYFKRKELIKKIKPKIMQYVTRFPKDKYSPPNGYEKRKIIYVEDWKNYYDLETGFKQDSQNEIVIL